MVHCRVLRRLNVPQVSRYVRENFNFFTFFIQKFKRPAILLTGDNFDRDFGIHIGVKMQAHRKIVHLMDVSVGHADFAARSLATDLFTGISVTQL